MSEGWREGGREGGWEGGREGGKVGVREGGMGELIFPDKRGLNVYCQAKSKG